MDYILELKFKEKPNYKFIINELEAIRKKLHNYGSYFDWMQEDFNNREERIYRDAQGSE